MQSFNRLSSSEQHARYLELCSLFCTGSLSSDEADDFELHLSGCKECRRLLADYRAIVTTAIPLLADESEIQEVSGFDRELRTAKKDFFASLEQGSSVPRIPATRLVKNSSVFPACGYILTILLLAFVGVAGYWLGANHKRDLIGRGPVADQAEVQLRAQVESATAERDRLDAKLKVHNRLLQDLNNKIVQQLDEISKLKKIVEESEKAKSDQRLAVSHLSDENSALRSDRDNAGALLQNAEKSLAELKQQVDHLESERVANLLESVSLQKKVADLNDQLASHTTTVSEQQKLLASDRDIRELMGARDLYIADVLDVDQDGRTRKPFGRVFYTKNKSLIFYAFDLDKSRGFRNTKAFQAWGAKSSDKSQAVSMGIFYMDNEVNRRWVLKFDDPRVLQQIDSVFVTLEPKGGSDKPSRDQLLYAYLRTRPNHP